MFKREDRYIVFKKSDLTAEQLRVLGNWQITVNGQRANARKMPLSCVVVESDWPEFEMTWDAIQMRVEHPVGEHTPEQALDLLSEEEIRRSAKQYYRMVHSLEHQLTLPRTYEQGAEDMRERAAAKLVRRAEYGNTLMRTELLMMADEIRALPATPKDAESEISNGGAIDDDGDMSA